MIALALMIIIMWLIFPYVFALFAVDRDVIIEDYFTIDDNIFPKLWRKIQFKPRKGKKS